MYIIKVWGEIEVVDATAAFNALPEEEKNKIVKAALAQGKNGGKMDKEKVS